MSISISQSPTVKPSTKIVYLLTGFTCVGTTNTDIEYTLEYPGFEPSLIEVEANVSIYGHAAGGIGSYSSQALLQVSTDGGTTFTTLDGVKIAASYNTGGTGVVGMSGGSAITLRGPVNANIGDKIIVRIATSGSACIGSVRIIYHA